MLLDKTSFDAIVTDSRGQTLDVDCCVSEPVASGAAASITIQVPLPGSGFMQAPGARLESIAP
jgi:hypothetical protein